MKRTMKITFRLSPEERGQVQQAIKASPAPSKGMSHHVHFAVLAWAHRVLADQLALEFEQRKAAAAARKVRHAHRKAAAS